MKRISTLIMLLMFFVGTAFSQNGMSLVSHKNAETIITLDLEDFYFTEVNTPNGIEHILNAENAHQIISKGAPDLPKFVHSLIVPGDKHMEVKILHSKYKEYENVSLAPSKGYFMRTDDPSQIPFEYGKYYETDAFYPGNLAQLNSPYILRDFRGQALDIYPFQYNALSNTLRVYSEITLQIIPNGKSTKNVLARSLMPESIYREFNNIYERHFINYTQVAKYVPLEEEGEMLIICFDDFMEPMEEFVSWKQSIGMKTVMVPMSDVGTNWQAVRDFVETYYEENDLTYLLLVGDAQHIPPVPSAGTSISEGYSDNYYGYLEGDDVYQEVFVGRFSAETLADVHTQVQRTIEYEMGNLDEGWLNVAMGIAANEGAGNGHNGGEADDVHMELIRDKLLDYNYNTVHRHYHKNSSFSPNTTIAAMSGDFNDGVGVVNFCNHGSATSWAFGLNYSNNHVNALTNVGKLPFIWSVACVNGEFQNQTCFAETWLRATHDGEPAGAVAFYGSTINQPWHPPMDAQDEFNSILIGSYENNIKRTFGGISVNGVYKMLDINNSAHSSKITAETWTIFGDPSLKIRTDDALAFNADYTPDVMFGLDYFEVSVDATDAFATLSRNGEIISTASVQAGMINLPMEGLDVGDEVLLTIAGYNRVTYMAELDVVSAGPYANFTAEPTTIVKGESVTFTDSSGNGEFSDWQWNFGDGATPATADGQGPHTVVYDAPGYVTVSLTVEDVEEGTLERVKQNFIYVKDIFSLSVVAIGSGSVTVDGEAYSSPLEFAEGSRVDIEAFANEFWDFTIWQGDVSSNANPLNVTMDGNKNVMAYFSEAVIATYSEGDIASDYSFTSATGSSNCPGTMVVNVPDGAQITAVDVSYEVTAHNNAWMSEQRSELRCVSPGGINEGQVFSGEGYGGTFSYERTGLDIANGVEGGGDIVFELHLGRTWGGSGCGTDYNKVDNGTWTIKVYYNTGIYINALSENTSMGEVEGSGSFDYEEEVVLTAHAHDGHYFTQWTENGEFVSEENPLVFDAEHSRVLTAHFAVHVYDVVAESNHEDYGLVHGSGQYDHGQSVELLADPAEGYEFKKWTLSDEEYSVENPLVFNATENLYLVAVFEDPLQISLLSDKYNVNVYPNPAQNLFTIDSDINISEVQILDMSGRVAVLKSTDAKKISLNVSELDSGVYILHIFTNEGTLIRKLNVLK